MSDGCQNHDRGQDPFIKINKTETELPIEAPINRTEKYNYMLPTCEHPHPKSGKSCRELYTDKNVYCHNCNKAILLEQALFNYEILKRAVLSYTDFVGQLDAQYVKYREINLMRKELKYRATEEF